MCLGSSKLILIQKIKKAISINELDEPSHNGANRQNAIRIKAVITLLKLFFSDIKKSEKKFRNIKRSKSKKVNLFSPQPARVQKSANGP